MRPDAIASLVARFQRAFDLLDWEDMRRCLADQLWVDYSSFRGTAPGWTSASAYVDARRQALSDLEMQHNHTNLSVAFGPDDTASATCNYQIYRWAPEGDAYFHSWGTYRFEFLFHNDEWKIASITQTLLRSEGDPSIHGAL